MTKIPDPEAEPRLELDLQDSRTLHEVFIRHIETSETDPNDLSDKDREIADWEELCHETITLTIGDIRRYGQVLLESFFRLNKDDGTIDPEKLLRDPLAMRSFVLAERFLQEIQVAELVADLALLPGIDDPQFN